MTILSGFGSRKFILSAVMAVALFRAKHPELAAAVAGVYVAVEGWLDHHSLSAEVTAFAIRHNAELEDLAPAIGFAYGAGPSYDEDEAEAKPPMGFAPPRASNGEVKMTQQFGTNTGQQEKQSSKGLSNGGAANTGSKPQK